ncbi:energy transducer TonB [Hyphococcus sp.]|uniref:energy transducer TonB n=1 Tax=Hyphococcus sp. TaxID=2038636 RepID=UPI0035C7346C
MGTMIRFLVSVPLAALVTVAIFLALYNQLSPKPFIYVEEDDGAGKIYLGDQVICDCPPQITFICGWISIPDKPDIANPWTNSEKAVKEPPRQTPPNPQPDIDATKTITRKRSECDSLPPPAISYIQSEYPKACIRKKAEGVVRFQFDIMEDGSVKNVRILSSPDPCFNDAVIRMVQKWRYAKRCEGQSLMREGVIETITFQLEN